MSISSIVFNSPIYEHDLSPQDGKTKVVISDLNNSSCRRKRSIRRRRRKSSRCRRRSGSRKRRHRRKSRKRPSKKSRCGSRSSRRRRTIRRRSSRRKRSSMKCGNIEGCVLRESDSVLIRTRNNDCQRFKIQCAKNAATFGDHARTLSNNQVFNYENFQICNFILGSTSQILPFSMRHFKIIWIVFLLSFSFQSDASNSFNDSKIPSPLILVPGTGGSRAYSYISYYLFTLKTLVWVNFEYMILPGLLTDVFKLQYDPKTHKTSDAPKSKVFFPGWGSTETIEELDEWTHSQTTYFSDLVNELVKDKFYVRNKTIRGAPFDFRKAPNENENFTTDMKILVEETYKLSGNQKVVILGHSLGSLYTLLFLKRMPISWKRQYIRSFISVSGPFAGAVKSVSLETSGDSLGSPRDPIYFREMQRSFPSIVLMLPKPEIFGKEPIVITPKKNYSACDYNELFQDMSMPNGPLMYSDLKDLINGTETPEGIDELYCIHSYGLPTPRQLVFTSFPDKQPTIVDGDGDHTVNIESLQICKDWKNVHYYTYKNLDHMAIISKSVFLEKLHQILYRQPNKKFQFRSQKSGKRPRHFVRLI